MGKLFHLISDRRLWSERVPQPPARFHALAAASGANALRRALEAGGPPIRLMARLWPA
jgi:hypothetical protein